MSWDYGGKEQHKWLQDEQEGSGKIWAVLFLIALIAMTVNWDHVTTITMIR